MPPTSDTQPPAAVLDRGAINTEAIAALARAGMPKFVELKMEGCAPRLVWPADKSVTNLEGALPAPLRKRGSAKLVDAESFASFVNAFKRPGTVLTGDANERGGGFVALFDYHVPGSTDAGAQWTEHSAVMTLEPTPEWARWINVSGKDLDQRTFAEFLEDNAVDLVVPEGTAGAGFPTQQELMSVASTLQIKTDVKFASAVKLQNGQVQLGYVENIEGGHGANGSMPIPERFGLAIAPFRGTPKYLVTARLRYRGTGGKAVFKIEIERPHKIVESAFNDVRKKLHELTGILPIVGSVTAQTRPTI